MPAGTWDSQVTREAPRRHPWTTDAMRVLCWGTYDTSKPRTRILIAGLRLAGATVHECHADLWSGVVDKSQIRGFGPRLLLATRWLLGYPRLAWRLIREPRPDVVMIGFPGILDILVAAPILRLRKIPIAWDVFMSLYDTVVADRNLLRSGGLAARLLFALEGFALRRADLLFLDTQAHARRVETLFGLPSGSVGHVWVGVERDYFKAMPRSPARDGASTMQAPLRVLFYGQFIPLHGIDTIIEAARLMGDAPIEWRLIGKGQESAHIESMVQQQPLPKLTWKPWINYAELRTEIANADVCLGIFGRSGKAASVIPNKVFQIVSMGRPLITMDSPAIRELLPTESSCVSFVPPGDARSLAAAVQRFAERPRIADGCHAELWERIGAKAIGQQCLGLFRTRFRPED